MTKLQDTLYIDICLFKFENLYVQHRHISLGQRKIFEERDNLSKKLIAS